MNDKNQMVATILHRNHKSIVVQLEKQLGCGRGVVSPEVEKVYRAYVASVEVLERRLKKG